MRFLTATTALMLVTAVSLPVFAAVDEAQEFVEKAATANMFEIMSSELALTRARNPEVRDFANKMVEDHTATGGKLKQTVEGAKLNVAVPQSLDDKHQNIMEDLKEADAEDFDREYIKAQTDAHEEAVDLFADYADEGDTQALSQFAADTLPHLREHMAHVTQLKDTVK